MPEYLIPVLVIGVLILLNAIFVAAEFAIIGASRANIERRATDGHPVAQLVRDILHDPRRQDRYIATAQLGITFASLGLGMYGEHALASWFMPWFEELGTSRWVAAHVLASICSIAVLTYFHIVVGEMVPKSIALMHAERAVLWITRPMLFVTVLMYPLVISLNGLGNWILRLLGVRREVSVGSFHTSQELHYIVQDRQQDGERQDESRNVLRDLFAFGERLAREVMVPRVRVDGVRMGATPEDLRMRLRQARRTRYPVYENDLDHIIGVIHIKDALRLLREGRSLELGDVRPLSFVPETAELDSVLDAMRRAHTQMVVVMDEHGGTAGIISVEDLCVEIVGEFEEGSEDVPEVRRDATGVLCASGMARLDDVGEALGLVLEHPEIDTVSGLVLAMLERPSMVGDTVTYQDLLFVVTAVEGHGVRECQVKPLASGNDATSVQTD